MLHALGRKAKYGRTAVGFRWPKQGLKRGETQYPVLYTITNSYLCTNQQILPIMTLQNETMPCPSS